MTPPPLVTPHEEDTSPPSAPLLEHLVELRRRLMICLGTFVVMTGLCYFFVEPVFAFLTAPLVHLLHGQSGRHMIYTGLTEAFATYLKLAMFGGIFLSFPVMANQLWLFLAPGLYRQEQRLVRPFLIATPILFILGAALAYYVVMPVAWKFFLSFESPGATSHMAIQLEAKVSEYLSTSMKLLLAFGLSFQLPVILVLLEKLNLITVHKLVASRKYAFLGIVIGAAILTPPDFLSPFGLIIPLVLLYECSILLIRWMHRSRANRSSS